VEKLSLVVISDTPVRTLPAVLSAFSRISALRIEGPHAAITSNELAACLPPQLTTLDVTHIDALTDLDFLAVARHSLKVLILEKWRLPTAGKVLQPLASLRMLHTLSLCDAFEEPVDDSITDALETPSKMMPSLVVFSCC